MPKNIVMGLRWQAFRTNIARNRETVATVALKNSGKENIVLSHISIDIVFHEKDIRLSPFSATPVWGLGIINYPILDFVLKLRYGIFCW